MCGSKFNSYLFFVKLMRESWQISQILLTKQSMITCVSSASKFFVQGTFELLVRVSKLSKVHQLILCHDWDCESLST